MGGHCERSEAISLRLPRRFAPRNDFFKKSLTMDFLMFLSTIIIGIYSLSLLSKCYVNKFSWLEGSSIGNLYLKFVSN